MQTLLHRSADRGLSALGWLVSRFSFSFARYFNPDRLGFGRLLVLNDDLVAPERGFSTHHHDNMEIITIVMEGELTHEDSTGGKGVIRPGEVQIMSAGTGIEHSEYNHHAETYLKLFQIWIEPEQLSLKPRYDQKAFSPADRENQWQLIVSPDAAQGSLKIFQQAWLSLANLTTGNNLPYQLHRPKNGLFIFLIEGEIQVAGHTLHNRDSLEISGVKAPLHFEAFQDSQILLIEVPI